MRFFQTKGLLLLTAIVPAVIFGFCSRVMAQEDMISAGRLVHYKGYVRILADETAEPAGPVAGQALYDGNLVLTGPDGWAAILMADETMIQLNRNTRFLLKSVDASAGWHRIRGILPASGNVPGGSVYRMDSGEIWLQNKNPDARIGIETPAVSAGIRGTEVGIRIEDNLAVTMSVLEGRVEAFNAHGSVLAGPGEMISAALGKAPFKQMLVSPENAVQWILVLPPVDIEYEEVLSAAAGDLAEAEQALVSLTDDRPGYGPAWSLLALVRLARGNAGSAGVLEAAEKGVRAAPDSPSAFLVLSHAFQALFDLDKALEAADAALRIDPEYVPAMLVRARILFGSGQTQDAEATMNAALRMAPQNPGVLTLEGFLQLAARQTDAALESFRSAIEADPGMGEAFLGLALACMRKGRVADAMEAVTTAVLVEPKRALFVSYWAKMLYQVKRFDRALAALSQAKKLDPLDPTPFLYEALILRDLNRPVEAVAALNQAVRLNDNRAVYRSRFLLDQDLAVKNIDQSIVFQDLGLSEWARIKALAAVKTDYGNSAAHTFLAGSLLAMEDRLRSSASENLLGLMLQKANLNSLNTFQEYTSFFEAPSVSGTLTGTAGNHDTYTTHAIFYGALPFANLAFNSIAGSGETGGWRGDNGRNDINAGFSLKWDPTTRDGFMLLASGLQADTTGRQSDPYEYDAPPMAGNRLESDSGTATLGWHRSIAPGADILVMGRKRMFKQASSGNNAFWVDPEEGVAAFNTFYDRLDMTSDQAQVHFLYNRIGSHQLIAGMLHQWRRKEVYNRSLYEYSLWRDGFWYDLGTETQIIDHTLGDRYQSYYGQDIWQVNPWLTAEFALYYDVLKNHNTYSGAMQKQEILNPRAGLILTPTGEDTIRIAGFRYVTPFTIDRLDPTDIAGIPLFRNSYENTVTTEYDLAWEHEWDKGCVVLNLFSLEGRAREAALGGGSLWDTRVKGIEPAWNQIVGPGMGLNVRYRFLDIEDDFSPEKNRTDHLVAAGLKLVHPSGIFAGLSQSFRQINFKAAGRENETIWVTDLEVGCRFSEKRGSIEMKIGNLFDNHFNWVVDDMVFTGRVPSRQLLVTLSLNF